MGEGLLDEGSEVERMIARSDFGYDAAVLPMQLDLRSDLRGEYKRGLPRFAGEDGDRGFIAGGFEGEKEHGGKVEGSNSKFKGPRKEERSKFYVPSAKEESSAAGEPFQRHVNDIAVAKGEFTTLLDDLVQLDDLLLGLMDHALRHSFLARKADNIDPRIRSKLGPASANFLEADEGGRSGNLCVPGFFTGVPQR